MFCNKLTSDKIHFSHLKALNYVEFKKPWLSICIISYNWCGLVFQYSFLSKVIYQNQLKTLPIFVFIFSARHLQKSCSFWESERKFCLFVTFVRGKSFCQISIRNWDGFRFTELTKRCRPSRTLNFALFLD